MNELRVTKDEKSQLYKVYTSKNCNILNVIYCDKLEKKNNILFCKNKEEIIAVYNIDCYDFVDLI